MQVLTRYKTEPLQCWPKLKELRRARFRHTWEAQSKGELVIWGIVETFLGLFAGMGDFANPSMGPHYTRLMRNPPDLVKCLEAAEAQGFSRDLCASMRCHLGQLYSGTITQNPLLGGQVRPDFIVQFNFCHSALKTGQLLHEAWGVPYYIIDIPYTVTPHTKTFLFDQLQELIPWMEKVTGRRFNDEKFIEATEIEWENSVLLARVYELNKNIPAPLDHSIMDALYLPLETAKHKREVLGYTRMLYDEVQHRVKEGISSQGYETARLLHEGIMPFFCPQFFELPHEYGAIYVGGGVIFSSYTAWEVLENGSWQAARTPQERGIALHTREDALWAQVELNMDYAPMQNFCFPVNRPQEFIARVQDWQADGVVLHLDRGCKCYQATMMETKLALQKAGIPTMTYEGSQADPRDLSLPQVKDQLDAFLESLGLTRIPRPQAPT